MRYVALFVLAVVLLSVGCDVIIEQPQQQPDLLQQIADFINNLKS